MVRDHSLPSALKLPHDFVVVSQSFGQIQAALTLDAIMLRVLSR